MAKPTTRRNGRNGATHVAPKPRVSETAREQDGNGHVDAPAQSQRLPVLKTYKIYIGGKFPRTESGRYYLLKNPKTGEALANICQGSRKDFREAVLAARN